MKGRAYAMRPYRAWVKGRAHVMRPYRAWVNGRAHAIRRYRAWLSASAAGLEAGLKVAVDDGFDDAVEVRDAAISAALFEVPL